MIEISDLRDGNKDTLLERLAGRNRLQYADIAANVEKILEDVRTRGDSAVFDYTMKFDGVELTPGTIKVSEKEIAEAYAGLDGKLLEAIRRAKANIEAFHALQKGNSWFSTGNNGVILGQLYRPLETVGVYVPGGTAAYPSSVLMNIVPAKVAGVHRVVMATPPGKNGSVNPAILVAANEAGADEVYRVGGAQAVASLAFGTASIPRVDKITGPGNIYVAAAKRMVFGYCDIDMVAGPSEIVVVADDSADPGYVAADMLSQAEHDALASAVLVTDSEALARAVRMQIEMQAELLPRKDIAMKSINDCGAIAVVESVAQAVEIVNSIAPEHLELCVREPFALLDGVRNAGAIFLGQYAPEPVGDYFAGPNHVLPTGGTARFFSPLGVSDFVKKSSVISYTRKALEEAKDDIILFAESEGLAAHANAIRIRFREDCLAKLAK